MLKRAPLRKRTKPGAERASLRKRTKPGATIRTKPGDVKSVTKKENKTRCNNKNTIKKENKTRC